MKQKNILICASICGSTLEWYDFSLFGMLAPVLSQLFFPNENSTVSLLQTFAVFATGFMVRPIGGFFWGYWGDRLGRKKTLIYIISLMTFSTVMIGFIPTAKHFGVFATVLLIMLRMLQGFSASGEHAGMSAYLYEKASPGQKGLMASLSIVGVYFGMSLALVISLSMNMFFGHEEMLRWAWRIPFLLSLFLGFIAYFFRIKCTESVTFLNHIKKTPFVSIRRWARSLSGHIKYLLSGVGLFQLSVVIPYIIFVYMVSFSIKNKILPDTQIYLITLINLAITGIFVAIFAYLSEQLKPYKFVLFSIFGLAFGTIFFYPLFFTAHIIIQFIAQLYFGFFLAMLVGPLVLMFSQWFPVDIRFTGIALCFNFAATLFGGVSPFLMSLFQLSRHPIIFSTAFIFSSCILALLSISLINKGKQQNYAYVQ